MRFSASVGSTHSSLSVKVPSSRFTLVLHVVGQATCQVISSGRSALYLASRFSLAFFLLMHNAPLEFLVFFTGVIELGVSCGVGVYFIV